jgi:RimJ/RimL family protein N-acetyltransferase
MTLAHGTDRLESARLVLRRIAPDDLPFFTRLHALSEVARHLYPGGRPRTPEESAAWLQSVLTSYEQLALGYLAVVRKADGALIGRCASWSSLFSIAFACLLLPLILQKAALSPAMVSERDGTR